MLRDNFRASQCGRLAAYDMDIGSLMELIALALLLNILMEAQVFKLHKREVATLLR